MSRRVGRGAVWLAGAGGLAILLGFAGSGCLAIEPDPPAVPGSTGGGSSEGAEGSSAGSTTSTSDDVGGSSVGASTSGSSTSGSGDLPDGVGCEMDLCLPPEICCAAMAGSSCAERCGPTEVPQECDGPEDCGGATCCFGLTAGSTCAERCAAPTSDVACHSDDDCAAGSCTPHPFIYWISTCS